MRKTRQLILKGLFSIIALLFMQAGFAQTQRTVSGTVTDSTGAAVPNVSVLVQGKTTGVVTNLEGNYSIRANDGDILVFSSVGFQTEYGEVRGASPINITLNAGIEAAGDEVVVTALGIRRASKSLGYAVQEIKGDAIAATNEPNIANSLSGQVAGLQVVKSAGPTGSSKIVLRGFNSLTGDNQPLIVVDGVPINNFTSNSNNDFWNPTLDMGNGLSDLNPDDIQSMSVLKGASAAALYGTRAGNGVILITTKTGRAQKGLGITFSSSVGFDNAFMRPDMQNDFGQGDQGIYRVESGTSWGPKITGQTIKRWDSASIQMSAYDNLRNFLRTGIQSNQSLSLQQQYKNTSVYASYNRLDDIGTVPGIELRRNNLTTRSVSKFGKDDKWTFDAKVQYSNALAKNRPMGGPRSENISYMLYLFPRSLDITGFSAATRPDGNMLWYGTSNEVNPYWASKYRTNQDYRDRLIMSASLKHEFASWLTGELRAGSDMYWTNTEDKTYAGSSLTPTGRFSMGKDNFGEQNYSAMLTAQKTNLGDSKFGGVLTLGGNLMSQKFSSMSGSAGELEVPNLFSLTNSKSNPTVGQGFYQRRINSIYGTAQLSYDGYLFIDGTFRNDWSSTLHPRNRSFFYPSISLSYVFSEMIEKNGGTLPSWFNYGKARASWAAVGNDLAPYQLYNTYWIGKDPNGATNAGRNNVLYNDSVRSELIKSVELGTEFRFFNNRLSLDFSWYKSNATRQLLNIPMDPLSGYTARKINAGDIQNTGIEIILNGKIIQNFDRGFNWDMTVNFSRNRNTIVSLAPDLGVTRYGLGGFDNVQIYADEGQKYGEIYGSTFKRVTDENSPYYNQLVLSAAGLPQIGEQSAYLGNQQPDMLLGITNSFNYKNFNFSFLIDGRFGGKIFSGTLLAMQRAGTAAETVVNGEREEFVVEGVLEDGNGGYKVNDIQVTPQQYWVNGIGVNNLGITEANIYDATNIRVRNAQLNYNFPSSLFTNTFIQRARLGVSVNNALMLSSKMKGIDPESVYATGSNAVGFEYASPPTSRVFFINLSVGF